MVLVAKRLLAVDESVVLPLLLFNGVMGGVSLEGPRSSVSGQGRLSTRTHWVGETLTDSEVVVIEGEENRVSSASELLGT